MAELPINKVVSVEITRSTQYPTVTGFRTIMIATSIVSADILDAANLVRSFNSMVEVAESGIDTASEIYKALQVAFSQNPSPVVAKACFVDMADIAAGLDAVQAQDNDFFGLAFTNEFRDDVAHAQTIGDWLEARPKMGVLFTNNADTKDRGTAGHVAELMQDKAYDHTAVIYHDDNTEYHDVAFLTRALAVNLDTSNSSITMKFKRLFAVTPANITSEEHRAITGFVEGQGNQKTQGWFANTYVTIGGINMITEGIVASGEFWDVIHFNLWLQARIQEAVFGVFATTNKVPQTRAGYMKIAASVTNVLARGVDNGGIAFDVDDDGVFQSAFTVSVPDPMDLSEADRSNRILRDLRFCYRLAGAVHYAQINGCVRV